MVAPNNDVRNKSGTTIIRPACGRRAFMPAGAKRTSGAAYHPNKQPLMKIIVTYYGKTSGNRLEHLYKTYMTYNSCTTTSDFEPEKPVPNLVTFSNKMLCYIFHASTVVLLQYFLESTVVFSM